MGSYFSKQKKDSNDFEKILAELDSKIQKTETKLSEIKIRQRRTSFMWIIYSLVVWIVCLVYLIRKLHDPFGMAHESLMASLPVILLPAGIFYVRKGLIYYFDQKQKKEENSLSLFRKEQKEKIEELKKKTSYYTTQSLIERYDDAKKKAMDPKSEKANDMRQRKPVSAPNHAPNNAPNNTPNNATPQPMRHVPINAPKYPTPIMPQQPKSQPQWYDRLVDALVGDAGPETKYALICTYCFAHNGLVLKEEYDTIQYVCPMCKQFNPSRKQDVVKALLEDPKEKERDESMALVKDEPEIQDESLVSSRALRNALRELKKAVEQDEENGKSSTIAGRVRQRHNKTSEAEEE